MAATGPDFVALQVGGLEKAAAFHEDAVGRINASFSPPHAVVFDTHPAFAVRDPDGGNELTSRSRRV